MHKLPAAQFPSRAKVPRRNFISTVLLGGLTAATSTTARGLSEVPDTANDDVLPTSADSLTLYLRFIDRLQSNLLHNYFELVGCLAGEVRTRYEQLRADVAELERLVPRLRASREVSDLKSATEVGRAGASSIKSMSEGGIVLLDANLNLISFSSESLNYSLIDWEKQQSSLTLSPRAVELLRKILQQIRDLNKPTEGLKETSMLLTSVDNDLRVKIKEIRSDIREAISLLVSDDLSRTRGHTQADSVKLIKRSIDKLGNLDSYAPPEAFQAYLVSKPKTHCANFTNSPTVERPTQTIRDLLSGTVRWIESDFRISHFEEQFSVTPKFVRISAAARTSASGVGLWFAIREILKDLPEASRLRTTTCLGLIFPVLIGGFTLEQREDQIYLLIPHLFPSGEYDITDPPRRIAAKRLASLSI